MAATTRPRSDLEITSTGDDNASWRADAAWAQENDKAGMSQVDSYEKDGLTASGSATFSNAWNSEAESVQGTLRDQLRRRLAPGPSTSGLPGSHGSLFTILPGVGRYPPVSLASGGVKGSRLLDEADGVQLVSSSCQVVEGRGSTRRCH